MSMILSTKFSNSFSPSLVFNHNASCSKPQEKPHKNVPFPSGRRAISHHASRHHFMSTKLPKVVINGAAETETAPKPILVKEVLHMNGGTGDASYAMNSAFQKKGMMNVKQTLQDNVREVFTSMRPRCLKFGDLGCSSGPNAFTPLMEIIETVNEECRRLKMEEDPPVIQAFLNDLAGNDFNNLFRLLSVFQSELEHEEGKYGPCFVSAAPGSFHGRLFPDESIHFFHSSYAINWLSQVPKRLVTTDGQTLNKGNICMAKTSPTSVHGAYSAQFAADLSAFLRARSLELAPGGRMVLAMMGSNDNKGPTIWELLGTTLNDMASDNPALQTTLDSFNLPLHSPCREEVRSIVQKQASLRILRLETFRLNWDGDVYAKRSDRTRSGNAERGRRMAMTLRAAGESVMAEHFGREVTEALFCRHSDKVAEYLDGVGEGMWTNHVVSLVKV